MPDDSSIAYSMLSVTKTAAIKPEMYQLTFDVQTPSLFTDGNNDEDFDDSEIRDWIQETQTSMPKGQRATLDISGKSGFAFITIANIYICNLDPSKVKVVKSQPLPKPVANNPAPRTIRGHIVANSVPLNLDSNCCCIIA